MSGSLWTPPPAHSGLEILQSATPFPAHRRISVSRARARLRDVACYVSTHRSDYFGRLVPFREISSNLELYAVEDSVEHTPVLADEAAARRLPRFLCYASEKNGDGGL